MTLRQSIYEISPPWLREEVGGTILRAIGTTLDGLVDRTFEGVKLRFPGMTDSSALGYIGNDRNIERGPTMTNGAYVNQLIQAFDIWRTAGSARTVLKQLRNYFSPDDGPVMRTVANEIWHEIEPTTGVVTRTNVPDNWIWDSYSTTRWWRGWVIIEGLGKWVLDFWDDPGDWGDGGVWGSNATEEEVRGIRGVIAKWKPAHVYVEDIIITFDAGLFLRTNTSPPNPSGEMGDPYERAILEANFWGPVAT